jgi:hypothetical protein
MPPTPISAFHFLKTREAAHYGLNHPPLRRTLKTIAVFHIILILQQNGSLVLEIFAAATLLAACRRPARRVGHRQRQQRHRRGVIAGSEQLIFTKPRDRV